MTNRVVLAIAVAGALGCGGPAGPAQPAPFQPAHPNHGPAQHGAQQGSGSQHEQHQPGHHAPGGMQHKFDDAEKWAKIFDDPKRDEWQQPDKVIAALALTPKMTVADIGAGTGYFTVRLARAVPEGEVIATDIEPEMVRYLAERAKRDQLPNVRAVATPADDPQLPPAGVDRILVVDVWHHLGDRVAYAKKLAAGLRQGGKLAIVDFKLHAKMGPPRQHRLAPEAIAADLRAAGLSTGPTIDLPEQYIVIGSR
ncbi:MAG TPA: class I SAM-dependent methyltransferase [Kofleriaceae bacterium]